MPSRVATPAASQAVPLEPPITPVEVGDPAPDFSYQAWDGQWRHLHDVLSQGHVLLVFAARESDLETIEAERENLLGMGIVPVVVLDTKPGRTWAIVRRLGLRYTVLADPRRVIAGQFNATDPASGAALPGWFVIARDRNVRALTRGRLLEAGYTDAAARALALPMPGITLPASR